MLKTEQVCCRHRSRPSRGVGAKKQSNRYHRPNRAYLFYSTVRPSGTRRCSYRKFLMGGAAPSPGNAKFTTEAALGPVFRTWW